MAEVKPRSGKPSRCLIIAGPNGAGKTTFAREFLPREAGVIHFVNADLIAGGLSPLRPELAAFAGGRIFLAELDRLARARVDFAFETTLSGAAYLRRLERWKAAGYRIEIIFLQLPSPRLALRRIAARPASGIKADTTSRAPTSCAGSNAVGKTFSGFIAHLPIPGRCMTIPEMFQF